MACDILQAYKSDCRNWLKRTGIKRVSLEIGVLGGLVFFIFQVGLLGQLEILWSDHVVAIVTFFAPILTFTIAVTACVEQISLHRKEEERSFRRILLLNAFTIAFAGLACTSLVRLDVAAIKARLERADGMRRHASVTASGTNAAPDSQVTKAGPSNPIGTVRSDPVSVLKGAGSHLFSLKTDKYDPCTHLTITLFLFVGFFIWDCFMRLLSRFTEVKQEIRAVSYALNLPTVAGLLGMVCLAVYGFKGLSQTERESFIGGIIAFHLAFAAVAFLFSVIIPSANRGTTTSAAASLSAAPATESDTSGDPPKHP